MPPITGTVLRGVPYSLRSVEGTLLSATAIDDFAPCASEVGGMLVWGAVAGSESGCGATGSAPSLSSTSCLACGVQKLILFVRRLCHEDVCGGTEQIQYDIAGQANSAAAPCISLSLRVSVIANPLSPSFQLLPSA